MSSAPSAARWRRVVGAHGGAAAGTDAVRWLRLTSFSCHAVVALLLLLPMMRRRSFWVFLTGCVVSASLLGRALGRMGPLDQPFLHMSYLVPLVLSMVLMPLGLRALVTPLPGAAILVAYLATRLTELRSPLLGWTVGCMAFAVLTSICFGHVLYLVARRSLPTVPASPADPPLSSGSPPTQVGEVQTFVCPSLNDYFWSGSTTPSTPRGSTRA